MKFNYGKIREIFASAESKKTAAIECWYAGQAETLAAGEEIEPPWEAFPGSLPLGWNQGWHEHWKTNVWLPFWTRLNADERESYLQRWKPPDEDWRDTVTVYWTGGDRS